MDNSVHVNECSPFWVGISMNIYMYISKMSEVVFSFNVKDNNICPCLYNIRLFYNI